jgi:hypothetical protein
VRNSASLISPEAIANSRWLPAATASPDSDVIGRVEECGVDPRTLADNSPQKPGIAAIAATHPVLPKDPDVARLCPRLRRDRRDDLVFGVRRRRQNYINLAARKTGQCQVDIDFNRVELAQLQLQNLRIPAGVERDLVVGNAQRPLLGIGETGQSDHRYLIQPHTACGLEPAMTSDDIPLRISEDRICEAELGD